jgi:hypothetical protein
VAVASVLVSSVSADLIEVNPWLYTTSVSANSVLCNIGKKGSHPFDFHKSYMGIFFSQPSYFCTHEIRLAASSLLTLWRKDSGQGVAFPVLRSVTALFEPIWPYSRPGQCQIFLAERTLLALL